MVIIGWFILKFKFDGEDALICSELITKSNSARSSNKQASDEPLEDKSFDDESLDDESLDEDKTDEFDEDELAVDLLVGGKFGKWWWWINNLNLIHSTGTSPRLEVLSYHFQRRL